MNERLFIVITVAAAVGMFVAALVAVELGRRIGKRQLEKHGKEVQSGIGVVDGTVYGLLSLLIGFSFAGAAGRFDHRRQLIADEINAIGTAYLRVDLLPVSTQEPVRQAFRDYMDALIAAYRMRLSASSDPWHETEAMKHAQDVLWKRAVAAVLGPGGEGARIPLVNSLNESFDAVEMEFLNRRIHPPALIFAMLGLAALAGAVFAGIGLATGPTKNWIHVVGFAATVAISIYVIVELEYPRVGLIRIASMDQALVDLRDSMK